ncbi:unnamed protein product, partial [Musa banksii]
QEFFGTDAYLTIGLSVEGARMKTTTLMDATFPTYHRSKRLQRTLPPLSCGYQAERERCVDVHCGGEK